MRGLELEGEVVIRKVEQSRETPMTVPKVIPAISKTASGAEKMHVVLGRSTYKQVIT